VCSRLQWDRQNRHFFVELNIVFSAFCSEEPNKTNAPLQVLAVIVGNSEKIRFNGQTRDGSMVLYNQITLTKCYTYEASRFSHFRSTTGLESDDAGVFHVSDFCS
jgi:hypothetical protein